MPYMRATLHSCYLLTGRSDFPAITPAKAGIQFSDHGRMQGWVESSATARQSSNEIFDDGIYDFLPAEWP